MLNKYQQLKELKDKLVKEFKEKNCIDCNNFNKETYKNISDRKCLKCHTLRDFVKGLGDIK